MTPRVDVLISQNVLRPACDVIWWKIKWQLISKISSANWLRLSDADVWDAKDRYPQISKISQHKYSSLRGSEMKHETGMCSGKNLNFTSLTIKCFKRFSKLREKIFNVLALPKDFFQFVNVASSSFLVTLNLRQKTICQKSQNRFY